MGVTHYFFSAQRTWVCIVKQTNMTDKQFQRAINKTIAKLHEYRSALSVAEREYVRRYGHHPSEKNNDEWIDAMHVNGSPLTVQDVEKSVELHNSTH